jgi:hypothetical protein
MATLIAAYNSEGCIGRCDAKCYKATCETCDCICGGANHGVGFEKAVENTQEMVEDWIAEYKARHPETEYFATQLPLFVEENTP